MSEPKFKVGDRVKIIQGASMTSNSRHGEIATIKESFYAASLHRHYYMFEEFTCSGVWEDELALVAEQKEAPYYFPKATISRKEGLILTDHGDTFTIPAKYLSRFIEIEAGNGTNQLYIELIVGDITVANDGVEVVK